MENSKRFSVTLKKWLKNFFSKDIALKIISLVFAMLLWGYVLMMQDPVRIKTISNVPVSIEGEADLLARKLVIRGNKEFDNVTIRVRTQLTQYADLTASDVTAVISLTSITTSGTYVIAISPKTAIGTVASITPAQVTVEVDQLVKRHIPVRISWTGTLPEGYWAGDAVVSRTEIEIEGAAKDLADIEYASAEIDLTNATQSINRSVLLTLYDGAGNEVDSGMLLGTLPSVSVQREVLNMKEVPVDMASAILGADDLPTNFELVGSKIVAGPQTVRLVGDAEALEAIEAIALEPIDISGSRQSIQQTFALLVPDGVRLLDADSVELYIEIREKSASVSFMELPIKVRGVGKKLSASLSLETADVVVSGRISLVNLLKREDVNLYIDLTGYVAGTYEKVPIYVEFPQNDMAGELATSLSTEFVRVVIN